MIGITIPKCLEIRQAQTIVFSNTLKKQKEVALNQEDFVKKWYQRKLVGKKR